MKEFLQKASCGAFVRRNLFAGKGLLHLRNSDGQTPLRLAVSEEMRQLLHDLPSPCKVPFNCSQGLSNVYIIPNEKYC